MSNYYTTIKDKLDLAKAFESSSTDEESSSAIKKLRPQNILKFKELLNRDQQRLAKKNSHSVSPSRTHQKENSQNSAVLINSRQLAIK